MLGFNHLRNDTIPNTSQLNIHPNTFKPRVFDNARHDLVRAQVFIKC